MQNRCILRVGMRGLIRWTMVLSLLAVASPVWGHSQAASADAVRAAFIYRFLFFIEWPPDTFPNPQSPLDLCVLGSLDDSAKVTALGAKRTRSRAIRVRSIRRGDAATACHVLYVPGSSTLPVRYRGLRGVLTIGDGEDFLAQGGVIQMVVQRRRIRFYLGDNEAQRAGLKVSSQLRAVALRGRP